jgi:hypothetical protein
MTYSGASSYLEVHAMRLSAGGIASAIIAIGGGIVSLLFGGIMIFALFATRVPPPGQPAPPIPMGLILGVMIGLYWGFGIWGIVSAIGLLRLRNWARICFAVYGGILAAFSLCGVFGMAMAAMVPQPTLPPNVSPELMTRIFAIFAVVALLFTALGIWWAIYFTRPRIKAQFMSEAEAAAPRLFPLSITIIAWFLIIGGVSLVFMQLVLPFPMVLLGLVVRGFGGRIVALLFAGVSLFAGIGMLKKQAAANSVAIGYSIFNLLNTLSLWIVPGAVVRMQDAIQDMMPLGQVPQMDVTSFKLMMLPTAMLIVIALWFLITRRQSFLQETH